MGRLIPAGTGMPKYHDHHIKEEIIEVEEDDDSMLFEFGEDEIRALPQEVAEPK